MIRPLLLLLLAASAPAQASNCTPIRNLAQAFASSDTHIFKGTVAKVEALPRADPDRYLAVTFQALKMYRGEPAARLTIQFDRTTDGRKFEFRPGDVYFISAFQGRIERTAPGSDSSAFEAGEHLFGNDCSLRRRVAP